MSKQQKNQPAIAARIESLSHEGRGVTHVNGKTVFVDGALPGEDIMMRIHSFHRKHDEATVVEVITPSPHRVTPGCVHYGLCGGCSLQHMDGAQQIESKQQIMLDNMRHIGKVEPENILPPLRGPLWGYRRRARLGAKYVIKKDKVMVGFREKHSHYLAELTRCEVLDPSVGERIMALRELLTTMSARQRIPQIEVAVADEGTAYVVRNLEPLLPADEEKLIAYAQANNALMFLQSGGPDTIKPLWPEQISLSYRLPEFNVQLFFKPNDFVQVNGELNRAMVHYALELLAPTASDTVLDLFCGLGNFTLPLARRARHVVGVEGEANLVQRARDNAQHNGIENVQFHVGDLAHDCSDAPWARGAKYDKILLDPARAGAIELLPLLATMKAKRIVYVSCNPATLARDAGELVTKFGYHLRHVGVMDMFPHTTHVESIAVFEL